MTRSIQILTIIAILLASLTWVYRMDYGLSGTWLIGDIIRHHIFPWFLVGAWCLVGWSVGRLMGVEGWIYQVSTGLAVITTGLFVMGLMGILYGWLVAGMGVGLIVASKPEFSPRRIVWHEDKYVPLIMLIAVGWYIYRTLPLATLPAVGWDENNSHLVLPALYVQAHAIHFYPAINFSNFPQLAGMLVTLQRFWTLTPGACWAYLATLGTLVPIYRLSGRWIGGWVACLAYLAIPMVTQYGLMVLVDPILTLYGTLLVMAMVERRSAVTVGVLAGACAACKYTGIVWVVVAGLIWVWGWIRSEVRK